MCGITGIYAFNLIGKFNKVHITQATMSLQKRGPDYQDIYIDEWVGLGHRRLSIIDTSSIANQPMWDENNRYCLIFNGEIFNYKELRHELANKGHTFFSHSDTEVLLKLYIHDRENCLTKLNGFFAFCIYDKVEQSFFLARDRYGIKPLLYLFDEDKFLFGSEMKSILHYGIDKTLDYSSIAAYLHLNYIPAPHSVFAYVKKLLPGHYIKVTRQNIEVRSYYTIPYSREETEHNPLSYNDAKLKLRALLDKAVQRRLVADVPLGSFLSGGVDSSIITALASKYKPDLHTFSIGFKEEKFFDETTYAQQVATHCGTNHTVFSLSNQDLYEHLYSILNYIDEPFADSSAIAVYILCKQTRHHATVALSGDGADELFAGYNKHAAFYHILHKGWKENIVKGLNPLWAVLPQSRNNKFSNKIRQLSRFGKGMALSSKDRYWAWAGFTSGNQTLSLLRPELLPAVSDFENRRNILLQAIPDRESINDILLSDMNMVLPNDMLAKVDLMSMANSLEVRVPFLDFELVDFVFTLPDHYKINTLTGKRILKETFQDMLPKNVFNRPKKGFEVPLLKWFQTEMKSLILDDLLAQPFIEDQGIFHYAAIEKLKKQLFSAQPGDIHARIWGLVVFQWWWKHTLKPH